MKGREAKWQGTGINGERKGEKRKKKGRKEGRKGGREGGGGKERYTGDTVPVSSPAAALPLALAQRRNVNTYPRLPRCKESGGLGP